MARVRSEFHARTPALKARQVLISLMVRQRFQLPLTLPAGYVGSMVDSMKRLARWMVALVVIEMVLGAILYLMGDATTGPKFTFLLLVLIVNFPGVIVASRFSGQGGWNSGLDPVLGWTVIVGVSLLFYGGCIMCVHRARNGRRTQANPWKIVKGPPGDSEAITQRREDSET